MGTMTVGIIGAGRVGLSLASILRDDVLWAVNRGAEGRRGMQRILGRNCVHVSASRDMMVPDYVILTVADSAIAEQARVCADVWQEQLQRAVVLHCSGAQGRDILAVCQEVGARIAVAHPYQTIATPSPDVFRGIAWGIEAAIEERRLVRQFVEQCGGTPFFLPERVVENKGVYHASAVIASNYLTMLTGVAAAAADAAGIPAVDFLPAIMHTALDNSLAVLTDESRILPLTGPIARADIATIEEHVEQLRSHRHLLRAYCLLGIATVELVVQQNMLEETVQQQILNIFTRELGDTYDAL